MLYVFLVDTGTMYTFDMNLTMERVGHLQEAIARLCRIPVEKQVLLISGGEPLDRLKLVCSYSAGTDTNPIFLFCKSTIEGITPPSPSVYFCSEVDLNSQVEASHILPPAFETVLARAHLAVQINNTDVEELKACESMVHDQHLQQQGWAAVVANLEDVVAAFMQRASMFQDKFKRFLSVKDDIQSRLRRIPEVLLLLEKIPILPCLRQVELKDGTVSETESCPKAGPQSLYSWLNSQDPKNRVEDMINSVTFLIHQMSDALEEKVDRELQQVKDYVTIMDMKEIKGLEDRLYGLDQLMCTARKVLQEQSSMAEGFTQNEKRVSTLRDKSILPDLCQSHKRQLMQMLSNHKKLKDIKRKCTLAKQELSTNLHTRLRWVMYVQRTVQTMDGKLWMYHDNLERIKLRSIALQQVENSPQAYGAMVAEAARRRSFSQRYMKWTEDISSECRRQQREENHRRKVFNHTYGAHILGTLFPGFKDHVPKFATDPPKHLDQELPPITQADVTALGQAVPELKPMLKVPSTLVSPQHPAEGSTESQSTSLAKTLGSSTRSLSCSIEGGDCIGDMLFEHIDHEKISMSDQGITGIGDQERRMGVDDRLVLSLQEKFTVPESLSETLTAEVNSAAMSTITVSVMSASQQVAEESGKKEERIGGLSQPPAQHDSNEGVLLSSGDQEPTKSSDSDAVSHDSLTERKPRQKKRMKALSDTSPDGETSQEFTTADFYIDESMPSSMTESPAKPQGHEKDSGDVETILKERSKLVGELETEVSVLRNKLEASQSKLSKLQAVLSKEVCLLKESFASMRETVKGEQSGLASLLVGVQNSLPSAFQSFAQRMDQHSQQLVSQERSSSQQTITDLQAQLEAQSKCLQELQQAALKVSEDHSQELQQIQDTRQQEVAELQQKYALEIQELSSKHELELELETDRVRTELKMVMDRQELIISKLEQQVEVVEQKLQQVELEKKESSHDLQKDFDLQKEELCLKLEQDFCQSKAKEMEELREGFTQEHNLAVARLQQDRMSDKCCLEQAKQLEVSTLKGEMEVVRDKALDELKTELETQHLLHIQKLAEESQAELHQATENLHEKLEADHCLQLQKLEEGSQRQLSETVDKLRCELAAEHESECQKLEEQFRVELQKTVEQIQVHLASEHQQELQKRELESQEHLQETVRLLQNEFLEQQRQAVIEQQALQKLAMVEQGMQCEENVVLVSELDDHQIAEQAGRIRNEVDLEFKKILAIKDQECEWRLEEAKKQYQKEQDGLIAALKTSHMAEKQVLFNEAITRAVQEKERIIEELRAQVKQLDAGEKFTLEPEPLVETEQQLRQRLSEIKERESTLIRENRRLEEQVALLNQQLYSNQLPVMSASSSFSSPLRTDGSIGVQALQTSAPGEILSSSMNWQQIAESQSHKIAELESRLMSQSMKNVVQDKVAILRCSVGDLVLICLDDRHDQYVVFTMGSMLHFLHSECIEPLGLKIVKGEPRKNWVLAEITDKEHCMAKKPDNRFRVPVGTKFFRVKAKLWSPSRPSSPPSADKKNVKSAK